MRNVISCKSNLIERFYKFQPITALTTRLMNAESFFRKFLIVIFCYQNNNSKVNDYIILILCSVSIRDVGDNGSLQFPILFSTLINCIALLSLLNLSPLLVKQESLTKSKKK